MDGSRAHLRSECRHEENSKGSRGLAAEIQPAATNHCPPSLQLGALASIDVQLHRSDAISCAQLGNRDEATKSIKACLEAAWASSTVARYNQSLASCVLSAERSVGECLLPCRSDVHLMFLFVSLDKGSWSKITTLKAAVRAWHLDRDLLTEFEACWTNRARLFWQGLKKRADHTRRQVKRAISLSELLGLQTARLSISSPAGLRDAALAGVAFFGIRRISEVLMLARSDFQKSGDCYSVWIRQQKNDPCGRGMHCWIPSLPHLQACCPVALLDSWFQLWDATWGSSDAHVFCVTNQKEAKPISADSWRKVISNHFKTDSAVGTHSLRKGGASWFKHETSLADDIVQSQGGWTNPETMQQCYTSRSDDDVRKAIASAALSSRAPNSLKRPCDSPIFRRDLKTHSGPHVSSFLRF